MITSKLLLHVGGRALWAPGSATDRVGDHRTTIGMRVDRRVRRAIQHRRRRTNPTIADRSRRATAPTLRFHPCIMHSTYPPLLDLSALQVDTLDELAKRTGHRDTRGVLHPPLRPPPLGRHYILPLNMQREHAIEPAHFVCCASGCGCHSDGTQLGRSRGQGENLQLSCDVCSPPTTIFGRQRSRAPGARWPAPPVYCWSRDADGGAVTVGVVSKGLYDAI